MNLDDFVNFLLENWLLVLVAFSSGVALLLPNLHNLGGPSLSPTQAVLMINREKAHIVDVCRWVNSHGLAPVLASWGIYSICQ